MRSEISSSSSFKLKIIKCFECGLESCDKHMSLNAQNEILQIVVLKVLVLWQVTQLNLDTTSIMADESTDVSTEQLVICIRWVDMEMRLCEEYIGLMPVIQTNVDTIVVCIKSVLLLMNLRIQNARDSAMMDV